MTSTPPPHAVAQDRFLGFLIWQSISSTAVFLLFNTFLLSPLSRFSSSSAATKDNPRFVSQLFASLFAFLSFHASQLLFSVAVSAISSPRRSPSASPPQLATAVLRFMFVSGGETLASRDLRRRVKVSLGLLLFVVAAAVSGFVGLMSVCGGGGGGGGWAEDYMVIRLIGRLGFSGIVYGLVYGLCYVYKQRWVLEFPIIQRPLFFSFKMGLPLAFKRALKLSTTAYLFSAVVLLFLPEQFKGQSTMETFVTEQIILLYIGGFSVFLCWELSHHLHKVLHTKRFVFAPPKGSAAAETNPSEPLLAALEGSDPGSLPQYLAYLDLCMVCESDVDAWRRAAFFEETGDTYKRVIAVCLRPLELLASNLGEAFEGGLVDKASLLSNQLQSSSNSQPHPKYYEVLNNFQQYAWCARSAASLTACSYKEDRFGVAQLSGSNAAVISTLLSCLLAVEASMGKKTNLQPLNQLMGPANIKWATMNTGRKDVSMTKKRFGPVHSKAYAMADVLRTSIYCIVSTFHDEMLHSAKAGLLEKDWIISGKPSLGTNELLLQKLHLFLDFRAS